MKTDSKQMRFCSSSIFCTERNSATTKQIAGKTGKSVSQGGTDHVGIFPSDCTPISVSTAHSAQRPEKHGTGEPGVPSAGRCINHAFSVQYTCHYDKFILHKNCGYSVWFLVGKPKLEFSDCNPLDEGRRPIAHPSRRQAMWPSARRNRSKKGLPVGHDNITDVATYRGWCWGWGWGWG